jgi:ABC-type nitrate/sulfonate/bicarbonate transport system permease component
MTRDLRIRGFVFIVLLLLGWEILARSGLLSRHLFPPMSQVLVTTLNQLQQGGILAEMGRTTSRAAIGFSLAILTMIPAGVLIGVSARLQYLVSPLIEILRPLPTPVIIPVAMLFLGVGDTTKIFVIYYGCSFPILLNTIDGVRAVHPMFLHTARSLKLTPTEILALVLIPAALPQIASGVRTSLSISLLIGVVAEMIISTDGIGRYIIQNQSSFRVPETFTGLLMLAIMAYTINKLYLTIELWLLRWYQLSTGEQRY